MGVLIDMRRILVGTDFSRAGERAVSAAVSLARRTNAALRIVHVVPPKLRLRALWRADRTIVSAAYQHAGAELKRLAETQDPSRQIELSTGLISGSASVAIAGAARDYGADLLVVGALGEHEVRQQQLTLGGTALKLLSTTPVPLLLVRTVSQRPGSVLAAVDLSPVSTDVLAWARIMATEGEEITLNGAGAVRGIVERADAIDRLFQHIAQLKASLIVLGKHERRRSKQAHRTGSVSRHAAMFAPTNVLIVTTGSGT